MKPGKNRIQQDIAAITAGRSPVRQAYEERGCKPPFAEAQRIAESGLDFAGHIAFEVSRLTGVSEKARDAVSRFEASYEDVFRSMNSGVAI